MREQVRGWRTELETSINKTDKTHSIDQNNNVGTNRLTSEQFNNFRNRMDENCQTILRFVPRCNMPVGFSRAQGTR